MWNNVCQQDIYRLTYKTVPWPTVWVGSVGLLDGYDSAKWLSYGNTVKLIWSGKMKQMKAMLIW